MSTFLMASGYTNVHELIPWRTLSGRQQVVSGSPVDTFDFGESLLVSPADRHPLGESDGA